MLRCPQTKGQSVLEHGLSVNRYLVDLLSDCPLSDYEWQIPDYFDDYEKSLLDNLYSRDILDRYTIYHDCGKPYCIVTDASGNHFPDHARISKYIYSSLTDDPTVSNLIGWDMVLHTSTAAELEKYLKIWTPKDAASLFIVALCELHSNAAMFGGVDSTSFKIKYKRLRKRGKQLCKYFFGPEFWEVSSE
jgi:hypothetical protein